MNGETASLYDIFQDPSRWAPGVTQEYRGYELKKVDIGPIGPSDHSEFMVLNRDGRKVESFTLSAFDSWGEFREKLDNLIDYDPEDLADWLNRDTEASQ